MAEGNDKPKVKAVRDLLNALVEMHPGTDEQDVMIRLAMAVALDAVESYLYEGKYTPSVMPVGDKDGVILASAAGHFLSQDEQELLRDRQASRALDALEARVAGLGKTHDELREICRKFVKSEGIEICVDEQVQAILSGDPSGGARLRAFRMMRDRYPLDHAESKRLVEDYIASLPDEPEPEPEFSPVDDDDIPF